MTDIITPPAIAPLPTPPDPNDRATFNARAYPWSVAQGALATEMGAVAANVYNNATAAGERAAAAQAARDASTDAQTLAEAARNTAVQAAEDAAQHVASLPEGTINDGVTSVDHAWSSAKTAEQIEQAKDWPPIGGIALLMSAAQVIELGDKRFLRSGLAVHPSEVPDWPAWAVQPSRDWSAITLTGNPSAQKVSLYNGTMIAVCAGGIILRSTDNGSSWSSVGGSTFGSSGVMLVSPLGAGVWLAAGEAGKIARSTNDGLTWALVTSGFSGSYYINAMASDGNTVIAANNYGEVRKSTNGGTSWTAVTAGFTLNYSVVAAAKSGGAWLLYGTANGIRRSTDGGTTWVTVLVVNGASSMMRSVGNTVLVSIGSAIYRSADAGANWAQVGAVQLIDIAGLDDGSWLGLTSTGKTFRSGDDGLTWVETASLPAGNSYYGICRDPTDMVAVAVGGTGTAARSLYAIGLGVYEQYKYLRIS